MNGVETKVPPNFIRNIITDDVKRGKNGGKVLTRFPPDPTVICTSGTQNPYASISDLQPNSEGFAIFGLMIPIPEKRKSNT